MSEKSFCEIVDKNIELQNKLHELKLRKLQNEFNSDVEKIYEIQVQLSEKVRSIIKNLTYIKDNVAKFNQQQINATINSSVRIPLSVVQQVKSLINHAEIIVKDSGSHSQFLGQLHNIEKFIEETKSNYSPIWEKRIQCEERLELVKKYITTFQNLQCADSSDISGLGDTIEMDDDLGVAVLTNSTSSCNST